MLETLLLAPAAAATRLTMLCGALAYTSAYWQRLAVLGLILPFDRYLLDSIQIVPSPTFNGVKYLLGITVATMTISAVNVLLFMPSPQKTLHRIGPDGKPQPFPTCAKLRWWWAYDIVFSPRYIGYSYSIPSPISPVFLENTPFILFKSFMIIIRVMATSLAWFVVTELDLVDFLRPVPTWYSWNSSSVTEEVLRRVGSAVIGAWSVCFILVTCYDAATIVAVALGQAPILWPEFFGPLWKATTVAKTWG